MESALPRLLALAVVFVNGWTDAPNAIATAVGSGAMPFRRAVWMAAVCNFVGAAASCLLFPAVAATVEELASLPSQTDGPAVLAAAMLAIVLWAALAWRFGLPTSESHALLAGLSGGAIALGGGLTVLNGGAWRKTLAALVLSLPAGAACARLFRRLVGGRLRRPERWQRLSAALTALLHGAQDGQKFLALLLLAGGGSMEDKGGVLPLALLIASVMALGTACGGKPIVEKVGSELASLSPADGLCADLGAGAVLLACSLLGLPVSTTHAKVAAVCGAGRKADPKIMGEMAGAWILTFPVCGALAWLFTKLMI